MNPNVIEIFTDGSCHTQYKIGAWAAILLADNDKIQLHGEVRNTTHNRMEMLAVINAIEYSDINYKNALIKVYTDSQYVTRIKERKDKLNNNHFFTRKGTPIQNSDLVKMFISQIESHTIEFIKVKAHQNLKAVFDNDSVKYNSEVDKLTRQMVRKAVRLIIAQNRGN